MLSLPDHPDVVFGKAPLVAVRCEATFSPVLALMTQAGIAGLQEAVRSHYPIYEEKQRATFTFKNEIGLEHRPPVHCLSSGDGWSVNVTTTSVELRSDGATYTTSADFLGRFESIANAVARTISPEPTVRLLLAKENQLTHPDVDKPADWNGLLSASIVGPYVQLDGLTSDSGKPHGASMFHVHGDDQILEVKYGSTLAAPDRFDLSISRWTERPYDLESTQEVIDALQQFADDATGIFHLLLEEPMKTYLEPNERAQA